MKSWWQRNGNKEGPKLGCGGADLHSGDRERRVSAGAEPQATLSEKTKQAKLRDYVKTRCTRDPGRQLPKFPAWVPGEQQCSHREGRGR